MGVVYKARDPLLDRTVAVKTIVSPKHGGRRVRKAYLERFEREAKAAAKMQHPGIVTIFDVGSTDEGAPFMVLEYLPGETLADRLDRVRFPLGKAIQIGVDLASALGFAHKMRIVHRDVKPANVLHAGENRWKLADFGIARMPDSDLTQVGIFMGTPGYAPVEAIKNGRYTPQADVFAWGAVVYELLSGRIAYEGPDTQTTNSYVIKNTAPPPTHYDPSIPAPLAEVVMRALNPDTELRYKNGAEAEHALQKAWELCLGSNLVSPASLVGTEVPHGKAPREFHKMPVMGDGLNQPTPKSIAEPAPAPAPEKLPSNFEFSDMRADSAEEATIRADAGDFSIGDIEKAISQEVADLTNPGAHTATLPTIDNADTSKTIPDTGGRQGELAQVIGSAADMRADSEKKLETLETSAVDQSGRVQAPAMPVPERSGTGKVTGDSHDSPGVSVWIAVIVIALMAGTAAAYVLLKL
jgi:serine/threonine protein kinase